MLTEITDLPDDDLIHSLSTAHRTLTRHQARFIVSLAEFHDRALATRFGAPNTVTWLMRHHDPARRTAFEYLGVGRSLRGFPLVVDEFLAGTLPSSKVRFLLRYVTVGNEDELVELARRHCLSELEQALAGRPRKPRGTSFTVVTDRGDRGIPVLGFPRRRGRSRAPGS